MALVVCATNLVAQLQLRKATFNTYTLRLYRNDITPAKADTIATYQEATFTGYGAIATNSWGDAFYNGANKAEIDEVTRTFTQSGVGVVNVIYGYYITTPGGQLAWAERNPNGPFAMNAAGLVYIVLPRFTSDNA